MFLSRIFSRHIVCHEDKRKVTKKVTFFLFFALRATEAYAPRLAISRRGRVGSVLYWLSSTYCNGVIIPISLYLSLFISN